MRNKINIEWFRIIIDYLTVLTETDFTTEIILPIIISIVSSLLYCATANSLNALKKFSELLLNLDSILIGFTGILVTLLLTTENKTINTLKEKQTEKKLYGKKVSLFDILHILFTNALLNELILLLITLVNLYLIGLMQDNTFCLIGLILEEFLFLNIIFSMIRGVTCLYWTFKNNS